MYLSQIVFFCPNVTKRTMANNEIALSIPNIGGFTGSTVYEPAGTPSQAFPLRDGLKSRGASQSRTVHHPSSIIFVMGGLFPEFQADTRNLCPSFVSPILLPMCRS